MTDANVKRYTIRCENDPTTYHWQSTEESVAAVIREFEYGRDRRVATINREARSRYVND